MAFVSALNALEIPFLLLIWNDIIHNNDLCFSGLLNKRDKEIGELKAKIAEVLAVMPTAAAAAAAASSNQHQQQQQQNTSVGVPSGITSFAPTTLALDLPPATDLSYTGKLSSLGLAEFDMSDHGSNDVSGSLYSHNFGSANAANSVFSPKTNGKVNDV